METDTVNLERGAFGGVTAQSDDLMAQVMEMAAEVTAEETGRSGDDNPHDTHAARTGTAGMAKPQIRREAGTLTTRAGRYLRGDIS
ncbi:hypothetical protein ABAC460_13925 [Asticcacaulis sp. AC460]|nr:hypothetical protein ABAC460_13925 [Asticcacaulis sp. AC460]